MKRICFPNISEAPVTLSGEIQELLEVWDFQNQEVILKSPLCSHIVERSKNYNRIPKIINVFLPEKEKLKGSAGNVSILIRLGFQVTQKYCSGFQKRSCPIDGFLFLGYKYITQGIGTILPMDSSMLASEHLSCCLLGSPSYLILKLKLDQVQQKTTVF